MKFDFIKKILKFIILFFWYGIPIAFYLMILYFSHKIFGGSFL